jgi:AAA+ superfamily predicted ATPase
MFFYKLQGFCAEVTSDNDRQAKRELARKIAFATAEYNALNGNICFFVSDITDDTVTFGLIAKSYVHPTKSAKKYTDFIGLDICDIIVDEITINKLEVILNDADRHDFIDDASEIFEQFELDKITGRRGRGISFGENLTKAEETKASLLAVANKCFMTETLSPELERIYAGRKCAHAFGHPVHYFVETDNFDTRREVYKAILDALYTNFRLDSRRYAFLDFRPGESYSQMAYDTLYKVCRGGSVVVRYLAGDDTEEDGCAGGERETIENICAMTKRYRNEVLTIICLPRECKKVKKLFYENLGSMSFVEVSEDFIKSEDACAFLSSLAKEKKIRTDKKLFSSIENDKTYLASELQFTFDEWYNAKLKSTIYPQYKDISVARKEVVKAKPQGSAYDELSEMIGLAEAKQVIKKALNYYKMQKLYEEKGIKRDTPAMHMIFSGNPGTAKTTVARLFARIMRENRLLSKGHLVEVGRGDLVGKYVGWTAPLIKDKFKAASGGVLFIDEAYSLVDDRGGSFGDEAINTIVQEMENHRADVVVIFAGYPDKMEGFLQKNPGLRSRIAFHVPFADYDSAELCQIADMISRKNGMKIDKDAYDKLTKAFDIAKANEDFGNGRYVRNVFEQAKMNQASRLLEKDFDSITADEITTITADDIIIPEPKRCEKRRIGFY